MSERAAAVCSTKQQLVGLWGRPLNCGPKHGTISEASLSHSRVIRRAALSRFVPLVEACSPPRLACTGTPTTSVFSLPGILQKEIHPLDNATVVLACSSLALALLTIALVREVRLRRALQRLLARLLAHFRGREP